MSVSMFFGVMEEGVLRSPISVGTQARPSFSDRRGLPGEDGGPKSADRGLNGLG